MPFQFLQNSAGFTGKVTNALVRYRRASLILLSVVIIALEIYEHRDAAWESLFAIDTLVHAISILVTAGLLELLADSNERKSESIRILDHKHRLTLQFAQSDSWEALTQSIIEFPGAIADAEQSLLLLASQGDGRPEAVARWVADDTEPDERLKESCVGRGEHPLGLHAFHPVADGGPPAYCLPLPYGPGLLGLLRFKLRPGRQLLPAQASLFNSLTGDIALGLKAGIDSLNLDELKIAEATLRERRRISRDLHDHLGQNLGYLCLKLDQFTNPELSVQADAMRADLEQMRAVADESYGIVRDRLESMHLQATQELGDLLRQHGQIVARRAQLDFHIDSQGQPLTISPLVRRQIFYAYREALNNVEKHARASQLNVSLDWGCSKLTLTIADNGQGIAQTRADGRHHLGLTTIRERLAELQGEVEIVSTAGQGMVMTLSIPL